MFLVGLSGTTTTMRRTIGPIRAHPQTRAFLLDVMREVVAVGRAHGVELAEDYAELRLQLADEVSPDMTSSMHHDLERGNRLEVRWLAGGVVELGRAKGVPTPLNRAIADILALHAEGGHAMAEARTIRPSCACAASLHAGAGALALRAGHQRRYREAAPLLLVELHGGGRDRPLLRLRLPPERRRAIAGMVEDAVDVVRGDPVAPVAIAAKLERRFALIGVTGVVRMALSALDMALWDALAVAAGVPLTRLLGGAPAGARVQLLRPGPDGAASGGRRGAGAARRRLPGR